MTEHDYFEAWWAKQELGDKDHKMNAIYRMTAWNGWLARSALARPEDAVWKHGDPERRKDNWTLITKEYVPRIGERFKDERGEFTFFGLVHADDDYYYGLMGKDSKIVLATCVGGLDDMYEKIPDGGHCDHCNAVLPVSGGVPCERYRCPFGENPMPSRAPQTRDPV